MFPERLRKNKLGQSWSVERSEIGPEMAFSARSKELRKVVHERLGEGEMVPEMLAFLRESDSKFWRERRKCATVEKFVWRW